MLRPKAIAAVRTADLETAAKRLRLAYGSQPIAPLRDIFEPSDVDRAYTVQDINTDYWREQGRKVIGYKIGLTSVALQRRLGIDEPDFGILFDDMFIEHEGMLPAWQVAQPRVEGEIAFVLGCDITDPIIDAIGVAMAVSRVLPAIEIVGSRIADWAISAADTIADNASAGAFVTGRGPRSLILDHLAHAEMTLRINGVIAGKGLGKAALGSPLEALAWLARKVIARGHHLRAGDVVLTGSLAPMVPLCASALVEVDIKGVGTARFQLGPQG